MECILHVSGVDDSNVVLFSEKSWSKTTACALEWKNLDGHDGEMARRCEEFWASEQSSREGGIVSDRRLFARMPVISRTRNVDLQSVFNLFTFLFYFLQKFIEMFSFFAVS